MSWHGVRWWCVGELRLLGCAGAVVGDVANAGMGSLVRKKDKNKQ